MSAVPKPSERRRFKRVPLAEKARVMFGEAWHECDVSDISGGGVYISVSPLPELGEAVMFQMRGVGMIKGTAVHVVEDGFALAFDLAENERHGLADNLTFRTNRHLFAKPAEAAKAAARRHGVGVRQILDRLHAIFGGTGKTAG